MIMLLLASSDAQISHTLEYVQKALKSNRAFQILYIPKHISISCYN
jgi:hypothetical protein